MELYLLRHGKAVEHGSSRYKDDDRPLTKEGARELRIIAKAIVHIAGAFDCILSSPLPRALQTATIVSKACTSCPQPIFCDQLKPGSSPKGLFKYLHRFQAMQRILLVGHEPDMGYFASVLLGAREPVIEFKKAGFCRIDISDTSLMQPGKLIWSIPPKISRILGTVKRYDEI